MNTKNKIEKNKTNKQGKVWPVVLCLLLAAGIFLLLLNVEKRQMAQFEKGSVVVAIADVAEGTEITEKNLTVLFAVQERPLTDIPDAAFLEAEDLLGQYAQSGIDAGNMITKSMLVQLRNVKG